MTELQLTPEQEAEAQVLFQRLKGAVEREALQWARLLASKEDRQGLGRTEVEGRDHVHRLGAQVLESGLQERKKKGTRGRVQSVRSVRNLRAGWPTEARRAGACWGSCGWSGLSTRAGRVGRASVPGTLC